MRKKLLTISIAAYNVQKYLEKTLQSLVCEADVMEQLEVLIVDDGSVDQTSIVAQKYVDLYPDTYVLIKKENGGHGSTLNVAASVAHGRYFRMLDGDDWFDTEALVKYIRDLSLIDADCIVTPYCHVYEDHMVSIDVHNWINHRKYNLPEVMDIVQKDGQMTEIQAHELTVRTDILQQNGMELLEKCMYTDKEYVLFAILYARTFIKLPYSIYQYRLGDAGQSVGSEGRRKHLWDAKRVGFAMLHELQNREEYIIGGKHKNYLYNYVLYSLLFFCDSLIYADEIKNAENILSTLITELGKYDQKFAKTLEQTAIYNWWKTFFALVEDYEFVIFGAGQYGECVIEYLKYCHKQPVAVLDNNQQLWAATRYGNVIHSPEILLSQHSNAKVIIAIKNQPETIEKQLIAMGVSSDRILTFRRQ